MFKTFTGLIFDWYSLFIDFNFNFLFILLISFVFVCVINSYNNINLFLNISILIVILTSYLFKINSGAYAGFLFLCELVSLFSLFIVLNKIINNELVVKKINIVYKNIIIIIYTILFLFTFKLMYRNLFLQTRISFFENSLLNNNDFWSVFLFLFNNKYNFYVFIIIFLILITYHIVIIINLSRFNNFYSCNKVNDFFSAFLKKLFQENNYINFKNKILLNFFKKGC